MTEKELYLENLREYHNALAITLEKEYGIFATYTEAMAWGYTSTAFYVKTKEQDYVARVGQPTEEKKGGMEKDIFFANRLKEILPTAKFAKNKSGSYISKLGDRIMCVSEHIKGMPPFKMNETVYKESMDKLKLIHEFSTEKLEPYVSGKGRLLHGDFTPSNILVSYDKLVGILDFEMAHLGDVEWDIAKAVVFFWFRWKNASFQRSLKTALEGYDDKSLNEQKILKYAKEHTHRHLKNIVAHKEYYDETKTWDEECDFVIERLRIIEELL